MRIKRNVKQNKHIVLVPARIAGDNQNIIVDSILPIDKENPYVEVYLSTNDSDDSNKRIQYHYDVGTAKVIPNKKMTKITIHRVIKSNHVQYTVGYIPQSIGYKQPSIISKGKLLSSVRKALGLDNTVGASSVSKLE